MKNCVWWLRSRRRDAGDACSCATDATNYNSSIPTLYVAISRRSHWERYHSNPLTHTHLFQSFFVQQQENFQKNVAIISDTMSINKRFFFIKCCMIFFCDVCDMWLIRDGNGTFQPESTSCRSVLYIVSVSWCSCCWLANWMVSCHIIIWTNTSQT